MINQTTSNDLSLNSLKVNTPVKELMPAKTLKGNNLTTSADSTSLTVSQITDMVATATNTGDTIPSRDVDGVLYATRFVPTITKITESGDSEQLTKVDGSVVSVTADGDAQQTVRLPNATTISEGTTYYIQNDRPADTGGDVRVNDFFGVKLHILRPQTTQTFTLCDGSTLDGAWSVNNIDLDTSSIIIPDGQVLIGDATGTAAAQTISGDATIDNTGAMTLAASGVTAGTYSSVTVDTKGLVTAGSQLVIGDLDITDGNIVVGDATNKASQVTMSGDATIDNTGALTLAASGVTAGTYTSLTVNEKGIVTDGSSSGGGGGGALTENYIYVGDATGNAAGVPMSGDATISSDGKLDLNLTTAVYTVSYSPAFEDLPSYIIYEVTTSGQTFTLPAPSLTATGAKFVTIRNSELSTQDITIGNITTGNMDLKKTESLTLTFKPGDTTWDVVTTGGFIFHPSNNGNLRVIIDNTVGAEFDQQGRMTLGRDSANPMVTGTARGVLSAYNGTGDGAAIGSRTANTTLNLVKTGTPSNGDIFVEFLKTTDVGSTGIAIGELSYNGSQVILAGPSDYRLKKNVKGMVGSLDDLMKLNPVTFDWKDSGDTTKGFIAHELQAVVPEAVIGEKDEVDENGDPKYQRISQATLIPLLTASLKELTDKVMELEAKLAKLES